MACDPKCAVPCVCPLDLDPIVEGNVARLRARSAEGMAKYGTPLTRQDIGTAEWIEHAIEEALDLANYLARLKGDVAGRRGAVDWSTDALVESRNALAELRNYSECQAHALTIAERLEAELRDDLAAVRADLKHAVDLVGQHKAEAEAMAADLAATRDKLAAADRRAEDADRIATATHRAAVKARQELATLAALVRRYVAATGAPDFYAHCYANNALKKWAHDHPAENGPGDPATASAAGPDRSAI